eukprot:UN26651
MTKEKLIEEITNNEYTPEQKFFLTFDNAVLSAERTETNKILVLLETADFFRKAEFYLWNHLEDKKPRKIKKLKLEYVHKTCSSRRKQCILSYFNYKICTTYTGLIPMPDAVLDIV